MKFKILRLILILFFIFILLFQNCSLIAYASTENNVENQVKEEISSSTELKKESNKTNSQQNNNLNKDNNTATNNETENKKETNVEKENNKKPNGETTNQENGTNNNETKNQKENKDETPNRETTTKKDEVKSNEATNQENKVTNSEATNQENIVTNGEKTNFEDINSLKSEQIEPESLNTQEQIEPANLSTPEQIAPISLSTPETINPTYFFKESILDTLELNLAELPTITIENKGGDTWEEVVGTHPINYGSRFQHKMLYLRNKEYDKNLNEIITVKFNNGGTIGGKPIDIKFIYSDLHTTADTNETRDFFLSWCAYGKVENRTVLEEFFNIGFDKFNLDISFYYHGQSTPIKLDSAYFTVSSLDKEGSHIEATNSTQASNVYYYENTAIVKSDYETIGGKRYYNVFKGTISDLEYKETRSVICFEYNNKTSINFNMFSLGTKPVSFGYHVKFYSLNASMSKPIKSVDKSEAYPSDTLVYTIKQKMPYINNSTFEFNSFKFKDTLASCFDFNSINLEVKDYKGNTVTNSAGTTKIQNGEVIYDFNKEYLKSKTWKGEEFTFKISAKIKEDISEYLKSKNNIENFSTTIMNNTSSGTQNSNTVTTALKEIIKGTAKIIKTGDGNKRLEGAKFKIVAKEDIYSKNSLVHHKGDIIAENTTNSNGIIEFNNLYAGKYEIFETEAPKGYENLKYSIEFDITKDKANQEFTVKNVLKPVLPKAGGIGNIAYIFVGTSLILISIVGYINLRKKLYLKRESD